jgi:signal recognition particle receptor subunit beta
MMWVAVFAVFPSAVGGQTKIRKLWRYYYQGTHALIFVVDAADRGRLTEACEELHALMGDEHLRDVAVLVYANKADLPGAMTASFLAEGLGLANKRGTKWYIQTSVATSGEGVYEGLDWLARTLNESSR